MITFSLCLLFSGEENAKVRIKKRLPPTRTNKKAEKIIGTVLGRSICKKKDKKTKQIVEKDTDRRMLIAALLLIYLITALYNPSLTLTSRAQGIKQVSSNHEGESDKIDVESKRTIIAPQKAILTKIKSEISEIIRFIGRGALNKRFIGLFKLPT